MKKFLIPLFLLLAIFILGGCQKDSQVDIITTMFPQYSLTKEIVQDKLKVDLITPPGVDVHNYEFSSRDIVKINHAKILFYTSESLEPQLAKINFSTKLVVNLEQFISTSEHNHHHEEHDIHYWTSFENLSLMAEVIYESIIAVDEENHHFYLTNLNNLKQELDIQKQKLLALTNENPNLKVYYVGHNALHELADEINLNIIPLVEDIKPNLDITSKQIQNLVEQIYDSKANFIYVPELESLRIANSIMKALEKKQLSVEILELHGFHNVTHQQFKDNISILDLINQNYENILKGVNHD